MIGAGILDHDQAVTEPMAMRMNAKQNRAPARRGELLLLGGAGRMYADTVFGEARGERVEGRAQGAIAGREEAATSRPRTPMGSSCRM